MIEGVMTTIPLHRKILRERDFIEGKVDVDRNMTREVEEETGWRCVALSEAGALRYGTEKEGPEGSPVLEHAHRLPSEERADPG